MVMRPSVRRLSLVVHVGVSVGWLGAVAASLALGVVALAASDAAVTRAVYLVLEPMGWYALVPLSGATLASGLVQSLGTTWGLVRHYWVLVKFAMTAFGAGVLLLYMQTLQYVAEQARLSADQGGVDGLRTFSPVLHATGASILLVVALVLSVYKPQGRTPWLGRRGQPVGAAGGPAGADH